LKNNKLTSLGISKFFDTMNNKGCIYKLILDDNDFSGKGINAIIGYLWENSIIQYLSMNNCELNVEGCEAISSGFQRNTSI
jgi:hypothetical protein